VGYASDYFKIVEKFEMHVSPEIITALSKIDKNKDPAKQKGLFADAGTAFTKWNAEFIAEQKGVTDQDEKLQRSQFLVAVSKMKQAVQADSGKPAPKQPASNQPPKAPPMPYKPTKLCDEFMKARAEWPHGRATIALWALDKATTPEEAKALAANALRSLNDEIATIDFDAKKNAKDAELKKELDQYGQYLRKLAAKLKDMSK
jgi:hypothetical protein